MTGLEMFVKAMMASMERNRPLCIPSTPEEEALKDETKDETKDEE